MRPVLAAIAAALLLGANSSANAAGFCNCCGDGTVAACAAACASIDIVNGQCTATVDYDADYGIGEGQNPLYNIPLRKLWLGSPNASEREAFRRLLERAREGVEADRRLSLHAQARGEIDGATVAAHAKRYDDAIVNYYLGMQAYRSSSRSGN